MRDTAIQSKPFGDEVRKCLNRMNLSNTELSRRVNISEAVIRNLLKTGLELKEPKPQSIAAIIFPVNNETKFVEEK